MIRTDETMLRIGMILPLAVVGMFGAGFASDLAHRHAAVQAIVAIVAFSLLAASLRVALRRRDMPLWAAATAGGMAGVLAMVAFLYGNYVAHLSGWSSLDVAQFGSDDNRGQRWIGIFCAIWAPPMALVTAAIAVLITAFPLSSDHE